MGIVPDQSTGKAYLEIRPDREHAAHYGVNVSDIWDAVEGAMAGHVVTTTVEGRERFPIRVRYAQFPRGRGGREEPAHQCLPADERGGRRNDRRHGRRNGRQGRRRGEARFRR